MLITYPIANMTKGPTIWNLRISIGDAFHLKCLRDILKYELPIPEKNSSSLDIYIFLHFLKLKNLYQVNLQLTGMVSLD